MIRKATDFLTKLEFDRQVQMEKQMETGKKALVLGGGGSRGSYEVGVWQALHEHGYRPDIVTGTSVGALNGAMVAQDKLDETVRMWRMLTTDMVMDINVKSDLKTMADQLEAMSVFAREAIKNRGADTTPLRRLLEHFIDEEAVRASDVAFGLVAVALPNLKPCAVFTDEIEEGKLIQYLLASAAFFPAMQGQIIHDTVYIDGGYYDNVPIELAVRRGARDIIAIDLHAPGMRRKVREAGVEVRTIEPEWDLGNLLVFDTKTAEHNIAVGYLDGLKFLGLMDGVLYAFSDPALWEHIDLVVARMLALSGDLAPHIVLPGGLDVSDRSISHLRGFLLRHISGFYRHKRLPKQRIGVTILEMAGKLFRLDPTRVYTAREFERELRTAAQQYVTDTALDELDVLLRSDRPLKEKTERALELSRGMDARGVCLWLLRGMQTAAQDAAPVWLLAAGLIFPTEFLTAMYFIVLSELDTLRLEESKGI